MAITTRCLDCSENLCVQCHSINLFKDTVGGGKMANCIKNWNKSHLLVSYIRKSQFRVLFYFSRGIGRIYRPRESFGERRPKAT